MAYETIKTMLERLAADAAGLIGDGFTVGANRLADGADAVTGQAYVLASQAAGTAGTAIAAEYGGIFVFFFTIFVLAVFVGYYVVWNVTPALHSPLMSVTNAISSVIIVGALIAAGPLEMHFSKVLGVIAVLLASVNIFGGFIVTQRMLQMFKKKK